MSEYNEGDLIEAVKGERVARSRLVASRYPSNTGETGLYLDGFSHLPYANSDEGGRHGWTFKVIEKAKPPLPTEPGAYKYDGWCHVAVLNDVGEWRDVYGNLLTVTHLDASSLIRLEPVAETAKKVLDALGEYLDGQVSGRTKNDIIGYLAEEFGVAS